MKDSRNSARNDFAVIVLISEKDRRIQIGSRGATSLSILLLTDGCVSLDLPCSSCLIKCLNADARASLEVQLEPT